MTTRSGASSRARTLIACALGSAAFASIATACAWDWSVRDSGASASDASFGSDGDATAFDDGHVADADPVVDGSAAVDAADDADAFASNDAATEPDAAPLTDASCATLASEADAARVTARSCTLGDSTECAGSVMDLCGCTVFVADTSSGSSKRFAALSEDLQTSGCTNGCAACPAGPVRGSCLDNPSGVAACYP